MGYYFCYPWGLRKASIVLGLALLAGCSYPELAERGEASPPAERCGECHIEIYKEWESSPHARSFISEEFREASNDYKFKFCLGCHTPESIYAEGEPRPRSIRPEEGITCNSCHLTEDCKLAGPLQSRAPHPVGEKHGFYLQSELCGKCHVRTFEEWQKAAQRGKKTCQDCHMPSVKRKLIQDEPWQKLYGRKDVRRHTFSPAVEFLSSENPVKIDLTLQGFTAGDESFQAKMSVENSSIPHCLPTGEYGYREVIVNVWLKGLKGREILLKAESFFEEMGTSLKPGERREFLLNIPKGLLGEDSFLLIEFLRTNFQRETKLVLAQREFPIGQVLLVSRQ